MSSALKIAWHYKDICSFIHINWTTFWVVKYFNGSESWMQLENAYASKEWQMNTGQLADSADPDQNCS